MTNECDWITHYYEPKHGSICYTYPDCKHERHWITKHEEVFKEVTE